MKRHKQNLRKLLDRTFARFQKVQPASVDPAWERVLERLREEPEGASASAQAALDSVRPVPALFAQITRSRSLWVAVAAVLVGAIWLGVAWQNHHVYGRLESADGSLYRIVEGKSVPIRAGERIEAQEIVHSNGGGGGAILSLTDGSRLELRSHAEFSIERAADGTRIHLTKGSLIVHAAKQLAGHLYVQTKDVTVSVVGTVFLVKAEVEGSRVAVIEGEVRVQQGATEKKLGPGEQMTSNPKMESLSMKEELAWSSPSVTQLALLEQAAAAPGVQAVKGFRFEVASIRPSGAAAPAAPGARGGGANSGPTGEGCTPGSSGYTQQLDPRRLAVTRATLFQLIAWAYPVQGEGLRDSGPFGNCDLLSSTADLMSGGPAWLKTDMWDLQTGIPEGVFSSRPMPSDPKLQQMLQTLLTERFKLVIRRETRSVPVYLLKVGKNGPKFNGHSERYAETQAQTFVSATRGGTPVAASQLPPPLSGSFRMSPRRLSPGIFGNNFEANNVSMEDWAQYLFSGPGQLDRPVLDRTGLAGRFDFHFESDVPVDISGNGSPKDLQNGQASAKREAVKAIGFELEDARAPYEVWVIMSAEKAAEN